MELLHYSYGGISFTKCNNFIRQNQVAILERFFQIIHQFIGNMPKNENTKKPATRDSTYDIQISFYFPFDSWIFSVTTLDLILIIFDNLCTQ